MMAVDAAGLTREFNLPDDGEVARVVALAETLIADLAPTAPVALKDEATVAIVVYLAYRPPGRASDEWANIWAGSGAAGLLSAHVVRRAVTIG